MRTWEDAHVLPIYRPHPKVACGAESCADVEEASPSGLSLLLLLLSWNMILLGFFRLHV